MAKIKEKDFVEIEYTGKLKEENIIFDTTDEKTAKDNNIFNEKHSYGPVKVMIGNAQVLGGLDRFMVGKEPGSYKVSFGPEEGFGKKNAKLLRLIPKSIFTKNNINPVPGLPVNIDGMNGIVKTVSGGRCLVDFNHPLSGKDLEYELKINRIITEEKEKVEAIIELQFKKQDYSLNVEGENAVITLKNKVEKPLKDLIADMIVKFTKIKKIEYKENKK